MSNPAVSYVVAAYNHEAYVGDLLRSVLEQTYSDLEIVVVDDGSRDRTREIAEALAREDRRITVIAQDNRGVVGARNRGLAEAKGHFVSIVDSDDLLPQDRTERQVAALESNRGASMVYGDAWLIDGQGTRIGAFFDHYPPVEGEFSVELFAGYCFVPAISVMCRRASLVRSGPLWGPGPSSDYLKWIELGLIGEVVCLRNVQLGAWRQHGSNVSTAAIESRVQDYGELHAALEELARRHPDIARRLGKRRLASRYARCHFMAGFHAGAERCWPLARREFATALRICPSALHAAAWTSAWPVVNGVSRGLYDLTLRRKMGYRTAVSRGAVAGVIPGKLDGRGMD